MLSGLIKITRPFNVVISVLTIIIAALVTGNFHLNASLILAAIVAGMITAGANIINDIFDIEIDRINKPHRPLPSGVISVKMAVVYFALVYVVAFILAGMIGPEMFLIAFLIGVLLFFYSSRFKRTVLWGNLVVSLSTAMAFIFGAFAVGDWKAGLIPAVFAFFFHFGREVVKDMQDCEGDLAQRVVTFPGKYGFGNSVLLINIVFLVLILLTFLPYILGVYGGWYLITVIVGVDLVLISVAVLLWFRRDQAFLGKLSHLLKLDMLIGLLAIYVGG